MLEKFLVQNTESKIMKEAISFQYDDCDIHALFTRADNLYSQAKFNEEANFGLLQNFLKSDQILQQFVLFKGAKSHDEIK